MYVKVGRNKLTKGFAGSFIRKAEKQDKNKLPPIFDNKKQKEINLGILKNLNIETSFEIPQNNIEKRSNPGSVLNLSQKSFGSVKNMLVPKAPYETKTPN